MRTLRVARISERAPPEPGGKEIHVSALSAALADRGVEQHLFMRAGDHLEGRTPQSRVRPGAMSRVHPLSGFCAGAVAALGRRHRRRPFDLVHAHGDFAEATAAALASSRLGIPAVLTVHGGLSEVGWHDALRLAAFSAMEQVVCVSSEVADRLRDIGVSSEILVRPSGVRDEFFAAAGRGISREGVVAVGRLAPVKNYELLLAARDRLGEREDMPWTIVAAGGGPYADELRAEVERRRGMRCVEERDAGRLAELVASAGVFVLTSRVEARQREGVPTALLEAIAAGVPVVATRTGGVEEVLLGGDGGLLVQPGDSAGLAAAIEAALADREAAAQRAERARESGHVQSWKRVAEQTLEGYERAQARHARTAVMFDVAWFDVGGAEQFVLSLARGFAQRGIRTAVAGAPGRLVGELGNEIDYIPLRPHHTWAGNARNVLSFLGAAARMRPVAVNSHHLPTGVVAWLGTRAARPPARHVLTIHVTEDPRAAPLVGVLGGFLFERVLCVAEGVRAECQRFAPSSRRDRFEVVHAGIDSPPAVPRDDSSVGVVARLVARKGHDVLFAAWEQVCRDTRAEGWTLELWGEGPDRERVEAGARELERVVVAGPVPNAAHKVGRFPIVALPSLREGLPLVLVEAMAAGCAVVATDLPGCRELLDDETGLLVPAGDPNALAEALLQLIGDGQLRDELGRRGQEHVLRHYSRPAMLDRYAEVLLG